MDLNKKVAVITGAGSGIGRATALALAREGCQLALNDFSSEKLDETSNMLVDRGHQAPLRATFDVSVWDEMQNFAEKVSAHFGSVDIVINNAGVALGSFTVEDVGIKDFKWLMGINFWGMVYGSKAFLPLLKKSEKACLANVSSVLGLMAVAKQSPYCASKFAIRGFTEALRMEAFVDFPHVNILSIHPGGIKTNIARDSKWAGSKFSSEQEKAMKEEFEKSFINTPEYAAKTIIKGIKKNKKRVLIGRDASFMWSIVRWFPVTYTKLMYHLYLKKFDLETKNILEASK